MIEVICEGCNKKVSGKFKKDTYYKVLIKFFPGGGTCNEADYCEKCRDEIVCAIQMRGIPNKEEMEKAFSDGSIDFDNPSSQFYDEAFEVWMKAWEYITELREKGLAKYDGVAK